MVTPFFTSTRSFEHDWPHPFVHTSVLLDDFIECEPSFVVGVILCARAVRRDIDASAQIFIVSAAFHVLGILALLVSVESTREHHFTDAVSFFVESFHISCIACSMLFWHLKRESKVIYFCQLDETSLPKESTTILYHVSKIEACYKKLPRRSRSWQRNESAVGSSCTSLAFTF